LAEAKRIALAGSPNVKALLARVKAAEAVVGQTRSALAPQVSAQAGAHWLRDVSVANGDGDDVPYFQAGISASWLLFDGFATKFRVEAAKAGVEASLADWQDGRRLLAQGVAMSYLNCLLAEESGRVAKRDAEFNSDLLEEARKRFAAGSGPRVDVLNFSVRVRSAQNSLLGTQRQTRAARQTLAALLGLPDGNLPEATTLAVPKDAAADSLPEAEPAITSAYRARADLLRYEHDMAQLRAAISATKASYKPQIVAQADYSVARANNLQINLKRDASSSVGVVLSWDLLDGDLRKHTIAQNKALLLAVSELRNQLRVDIAAEVRRALDSADTAAKQYANQQEIASMSREIRDIVRKEYLAGLSPLTRLNEVQTDLVRAEGQLSQAHIRLFQALEDVAASLGANAPATE
jgi:outer membrane protein